MQDSLGITVHEASNRTISPIQSGSHTRHKSGTARDKLDSFIAQSIESLTIKDQVVLIIHNTSK